MTLIRFSLKTSPPTILTPKYAINCYNNTQKMTTLHTSSCYIQYGFIRNIVIFSALWYCLVVSSLFKNNTQFLPFLIKIAQNLRTVSYKDVSYERIMSLCRRQNAKSTKEKSYVIKRWSEADWGTSTSSYILIDYR